MIDCGGLSMMKKYSKSTKVDCLPSLPARALSEKSQRNSLCRALQEEEKDTEGGVRADDNAMSAKIWGEKGSRVALCRLNTNVTRKVKGMTP